MTNANTDHQNDRLKLAQDAHQLIGPPEDSDQWLQPFDLHDALRPELVLLRGLLSDSHVKNLIEEFKAADAKAGIWQWRYRFVERARIILFFLVLVVGAITLSPLAARLPPGVESHIPVVQGCLILVALVGMVIGLTGGFYRRWRSARAIAEHARGQFFWQMSATATQDAATEPALVLQQLEFLRRYRLQHQYAYFLFKVAQHEKSEARRRQLAYLAGGLALLVTFPLVAQLADLLELKGIAAWLAQIGDVPIPVALQPIDKFVLAAGVVAAGFEASIVNYFRIEQDLRFAAHFRETGRQLSELGEELPKIREAALDGRLDDVRKWARRLESKLAEEHDEWLIKHSGNRSELKPLNRLDPWAHP